MARGLAIRRGMMQTISLALAIVITSLSACVPQAPAPGGDASGTTMPKQTSAIPSSNPPAVQSQATAPTPAMQGDWTYWPVTPGDWVYRRDERGSIALFGVPGQDALATLRCDTGRNMLYFSRSGNLMGPVQMTLRASQGLQSYTASPITGSAYVATAIAPGDPMLDKLAYSRGRFAVEVDGLAPLKLPSWAEVSRVVEDCR